MARITIKDVKTSLGITETFDIINAIRNSNPQTFGQYLPLANEENVAEIGQGILVSQSLQNDFINTLVERIGLVVVRSVMLQNQLKKFKKGMMPQGRSIEDIFVDITHEHSYDPETAEQEVFKREIPNVKTLFHERNRQGFYKQTISDEQLRSAFTSWNKFGDFVAGIVNAMYNSSEVDEFKYMKLLIDNYHAKGQFTYVQTPAVVDETSAKQFIKKLRATATKMTLTNGSRDYNGLAVHTKSDTENLHVLITADLEAEVDVDVLASAFNMSKSDFIGNRTVVDNFGSPEIQAVLVDKDWFMVYDNLYKMETQRNSQGLYWNYWLHIWQTLSVSRFANAVAFVTGAINEVTNVIVDPTITAIKAGKTHEFNAYIRSNDGADRTPVWSVEADDGGTVATGTSIDTNGVLTIASDQTGQLRIKATVSVDNDPAGAGGNDYSVVGEAIVTIVPNTIN